MPQDGLPAVLVAIAAETADKAAGLAAGLHAAGQAGGPLDLAGLGFLVCVADLEDELIRPLGAGRSSG